MLLALVLCLALLPAQAFALDMQVDAPALTVNTSVIGFAGQEWYVIGYDGSGVYSQSNTATLLLKSSGTPYGNTAFRTGNSTQDDPEWTQYTVSGWYYEGEFTQPNDYNDSTLQNRMVAIADGIPGKELALINTRTLTAVDDINYPITGGDVANQKLWPLSYNEWTTIDDDTVRSFGNYFWLRSPSDASGAFFGLLDGDSYSNRFVSSASGAARPAFNLNLASVLFTSAASGASGKSSATAGSGLVGASAPTGAVKFTVKSASQELDVTATEAQATQSGATLTFGYTGATAVTNQYVSCVLLNDSDEVAYYGKLTDSSSDASGDLSIPLAGVSDGTYTLQIFSEEANGDNYTDFCSEPVSMTLNVTDGVGEVSSFGGTELDTTAPNISSVTPVGTGASISGNIVITLNETMDTTVTGAVYLSDDGGTTYGSALTGGSWSDDGTVYSLNYSGLSYSTEYTVLISDFKDAAGNTMAADSTHSFTTADAPDTTLPTATGVTPGGTGVSISSNIVITFSETMDTTVTGAVYLSDDGGTTYGSALTGGSWSVVDTVYSLNYSGLSYSTEYTVVISDFKDVAGNVMAADSAHSFTTCDEPLVPSVSPGALTVDKGGTASLTIAFGQGGAAATDADITVGDSSIASVSRTQVTAPGSVTVTGIAVGTTDITVVFNDTASTTATVSVTVQAQSSGSSGGRSPKQYKAEVKYETGEEATLPVTVDKNTKSASVDVGSQSLAEGGAVITIPTIPDVDEYSVSIPVPSLATADAQGTLTLNTDKGSVTVPSNMLTGVEGISGSKAQIAIGEGDKEALPDEVKAAIGDRPLISLTLSIDGKQTDWSNPAAPVTVSIPYTPTAAELANPESIVVWYIDGSGNVVTVPNGRYDAVTGTVSFFTTHFSDYAVTYVHKTFSDLGSVEWAKKAIETMASKGITNGTDDGTTFSPTVNITRADFMVLLIKTLGLTAEFTENFDDVKPGTYYYNAIGVAKKLGIAAGSGNNLFKPTESISRQDMMVLAARALEKYQGLEAAETNAVLERFTDRKEVAEYAALSLATLIEAGITEGSGGRLTPRAYTTRVEVAAFLYKIYNKYPNAPVMTASTITRLAGQSRIDTALAAARAAYPDEISNAVIATAYNYPDALAGSVLAYQLDAPILLAGSSEAEQEAVISYLKEKLRPEGTVYILGGSGVVSQDFEDRLSTSAITNISRLAGNDRYETSVKIAEQLNVKTGTPVVLVSGENYPDALSVSSVAAQRGWPVLLVQRDGISKAVSEKLAGIKPARVYIIGLEGAISKSVESQTALLTGLAAEDIVRLGGDDRYLTSLTVAEYFNLGSQTIFVATGQNFPDALAGSVYAAKQKAPIILTSSSLPEQTAYYIQDRKPAGLTILGGEAVVGSGIEGQILQLLRQ
jgi:putative cell wall-binding protein